MLGVGRPEWSTGSYFRSCLGLSDTCPQAGVMRTSVSLDGQVSDNPKQKQSDATGCCQAVQRARNRPGTSELLA